MYIIQEIQTTGDESTLLPAISRNDWNEAMSVFYEKASYAVVSSIEKHTVMIYDNLGSVINSIVFDHPVD